MKLIKTPLCLTAFSSCGKTLEYRAERAAKIFCECVHQKGSPVETQVLIYARCNQYLAQRERLVALSFRAMEDYEFAKSIPADTKDSIQRFKGYFLQFADSCLTITEK